MQERNIAQHPALLQVPLGRDPAGRRVSHRHGAGGSNWIELDRTGSNWIELDRTVGSLALFSLCFCVCFCFCFCVCVRVQPCSLRSLFLRVFLLLFLRVCACTRPTLRPVRVCCCLFRRCWMRVWRRVCVCACTVQSVLKAPWGLGFVELF